MPDLGSLLVAQPNGPLALVGLGLLRALLRGALPVGLTLLLLTGVLLVFRSSLLGALLQLVAIAPTLLLLQIVVLALCGGVCVGLPVVLLLARLLPALLAVHLAVAIGLRILVSLRLPVAVVAFAPLRGLRTLALGFSALLLTARVGRSGLAA